VRGVANQNGDVRIASNLNHAQSKQQGRTDVACTNA
jgi:hypothetical protein